MITEIEKLEKIASSLICHSLRDLIVLYALCYQRNEIIIMVLCPQID